MGKKGKKKQCNKEKYLKDIMSKRNCNREEAEKLLELMVKAL